MSVDLHHGDCIEVMRSMPESSVDSIVTDPPYGLGFMGKKWDDLPPGEEWARECLRVLKPGGHMLAFGGTRTWHRLAVAVEDAGFEIRDSIAWMHGQGFPKGQASLKPAHEPIVVARKKPDAPRMGRLQIDGCRVGAVSTMSGRWPANVILDESQAEVLDEQSGIQRDGVAVNRNKDPRAEKPHEVYGGGWLNGNRPDITYGGKGGASRFFYVAKASRSERVKVDGIAHPTVKPLKLMRWLVRLVTPAGGTVLETFAGSGATVEACLLEGFDCIAIEREADYLPLIRERIARHQEALTA